MSQEAPPGPDGAPLVGSLVPYLSDQLGFLEECAEYGDVVKRTVGGSESFILFHPDHVKRVFLNDDDFTIRDFGEGLDVDQSCSNPVIDSDEHPWGERVEVLSPAFEREVIDTYVGTMADSTADLVASVEPGEPLDVQRRMKDLVLDITTKTLFGEHRVEGDHRIGEAYETLANRLGTKRRLIPLWAPTPGNWKVKREAEFLYGVVEEMIEDAREDGRDDDSLLSVLLAASERDDGLSNEYLQDEMLMLLGGAHETTSVALTFLWHLVANDRDVQHRLAAEADEVLGDDPATAADVPELSYAEKVVRESLRLYPPVFKSDYEATTPVTFDGYTVPEGGRIILPQWVIQRDERWYDDPGEFRPGRWTETFRRELPDFAYFPFGGGTHMCIGRTFALIEMRVVLATTLQRATVEPVSEEDVGLRTELTLKPKGAVEMALRPR